MVNRRKRKHVQKIKSRVAELSRDIAQDADVTPEEAAQALRAALIGDHKPIIRRSDD